MKEEVRQWLKEKRRVKYRPFLNKDLSVRVEHNEGASGKIEQESGLRERGIM